MKFKLLLMPILLALTVIASIWWIYPGYKDMRIEKKELASAAKKLADIKGKNAKAEELIDSWNNSVKQRTIIENYIPEKKQEEEVISNINSLVSASGLAMYNLSVSASEENDSIDRAQVIGEDGSADNSVPVVKNFNIILGVAGDYGKIKTLLGKLDSLSRFNSIISLTIEKNSSDKPDEQITAIDEEKNEKLKADIIIQFDYMGKNNSLVNIDNEIFSSGVFDMGTVDMIEKKLVTGMNNVNIGSSGRGNPFVK